MFYTHIAECWVWAISSTFEIRAAAMIADVAGGVARITESADLLLKLSVLRLKIGYAKFERRILLF